ncbi:hypothetical protein A7A76_05315 [Lysobacter enzymogenes]|uniref:hypothetical protein n=1 Tax=Lysobacter enzymogenes TaxID=69 RepID=UPI0019D1255A|nr:hypothetical protein [Lysobacter enzymogenes]MBN7138534.1 hypothetical protein [Lysobacter enzymogenes]
MSPQVYRAGAALLLTIAATAACQRDAARTPEPAVAQAPVARPVDPDADLVVVVGERLALDSIDKPDSLGGGYRARYRVLQRLHGRGDGPEVEFEFYQHLGEPHQLGFPHALLFLRRDGANLREVAHYPVFAARGGGWAGCAPVLEMEARRRKDRAQARPGVFAGEASYTEWLPPQPGAYPAKDFQVDGNRIRCLTGTPVQALYELNKDILATGLGPDSLTPEQVQALTLPVAPAAPGGG